MTTKNDLLKILENDGIDALTTGKIGETEKSTISIFDPELADHPIAKSNAGSWPNGPKKGKKIPA